MRFFAPSHKTFNEIAAMPATLYQAHQTQLAKNSKPFKTAKEGLLKNTMKTPVARSITATESKSRPASQLLQLLHNSIAQYENLPEGIVAHHDKVTLGMEVSPDGTLSHLTVLQSSGNDVLDEVTLQAAQAASPVKGIKNLLVSQHYFSVEIIYS